MPSPKPPQTDLKRPGVGELAGVVSRNIRTLIERRVKDEQSKRLADRIADRITRFTGSMTFVLIHAVIFGAWIIVNLGWLPIKPFDPSFVVLAMIASVEAIFLSTFVLISQNRMQMAADRQASLDLQISLLSEHEITRLIHLVDAIAVRIGVDRGPDPGLEELKRDVEPEQVLGEMDAAEREIQAEMAQEGKRL